MPDGRLTIGELAHRTGVATSALRYWEQLGLLPPPAVGLVGGILLLREVGFTVRDLQALLAPRTSAGDDWWATHRRKLDELDRRIAQAQVARTAIAHALACPHEDIRECPDFTGAMAGSPLERAHPH